MVEVQLNLWFVTRLTTAWHGCAVGVPTMFVLRLHWHLVHFLHPCLARGVQVDLYFFFSTVLAVFSTPYHLFYPNWSVFFTLQLHTPLQAK